MKPKRTQTTPRKSRITELGKAIMVGITRGKQAQECEISNSQGADTTPILGRVVVVVVALTEMTDGSVPGVIDTLFFYHHGIGSSGGGW